MPMFYNIQYFIFIHGVHIYSSNDSFLQERAIKFLRRRLQLSMNTAVSIPTVIYYILVLRFSRGLFL